LHLLLDRHLTGFKAINAAAIGFLESVSDLAELGLHPLPEPLFPGKARPGLFFENPPRDVVGPHTQELE
jgi:hypothetical protein